MSVFRIVELGVDGDPAKALVQAVGDGPGTYPWATDLTYAVPVDRPWQAPVRPSLARLRPTSPPSLNSELDAEMCSEEPEVAKLFARPGRLTRRTIPEWVQRAVFFRAARTGWAAYQHAVQAWIDNPAQSSDAHVSQAFDDLRALSATTPPTQAGYER
ncbi:hypothetical protein [Nocardia sp. NPDC047648]|uniref:hypothetical protein n=1 Tax=Nocardia sp. NPDC047648 TaxID=3155625 RepID=UPI0033E8E691